MLVANASEDCPSSETIAPESTKVVSISGRSMHTRSNARTTSSVRSTGVPMGMEMVMLTVSASSSSRKTNDGLPEAAIPIVTIKTASTTARVMYRKCVVLSMKFP